MNFSGDISLVATVRELLHKLAVIFTPVRYSYSVKPVTYSASIMPAEAPTATIASL